MLADPSNNVSRETLEKLKLLEEVVKKWNAKINLVSKQNIDELWTRHIEDSAQLSLLQNDPCRWVDLGSGGGFPALVIAILRPDHQMTLVESDKRKCAFLRSAVRELELSVEVLSQRIETLPPQSAGVVSARALAALDKLLHFVEPHLDPNGVGLFMKGENWKKEVQIAEHKWSFGYDVLQSVTDSRAAVLRVENIKRK